MRFEDYDATVQLDPRLTAAYAASARLREDKGQRDHAIHDFDMALRLDPNEVNLLYDRGNTRRETGDWRGALADYDRAVVLAPQKAETYVARGWSRFCAGVEGADLDARVYLKLKGWRDSFSPYMAILAALAARQAQRPEDAKRVLDEAVANLSPRLWPVPVLRYLQGELTEAALLGLAVSTRQQAEAHTFIGLDRLRSGDRAGAILHLHWARDHGSEGSIALDVARARLPGWSQPLPEKADEPSVRFRTDAQPAPRRRDVEPVALPFRSDAGSGPTRATMLPMASLAATRTAEVRVWRQRLHCLQRLSAADLLEDDTRPAPNARIGIREPLDQCRFGDRAHFLKSVLHLKAVFLDSGQNWLDGARVFDLGKSLDGFVADQESVVAGSLVSTRARPRATSRRQEP